MSREKSRRMAATEARTSSPCWWPWRSLTCLKSSRSTITRPSGVWKRRPRPVFPAGDGREGAALARPRRLGVDGIQQLRRQVRPRLEGPPLGRDECLVQAGIVAARPVLVEGAAFERHGAPGVGLAGVHRLAHGQRDDAIAVEARGEGVADAADGRLELLALALDLLDLGLELGRHAVELVPQLGELVAAAHR